MSQKIYLQLNTELKQWPQYWVVIHVDSAIHSTEEAQSNV